MTAGRRKSSFLPLLRFMGGILRHISGLREHLHFYVVDVKRWMTAVEDDNGDDLIFC